MHAEYALTRAARKALNLGKVKKTTGKSSV
jgi:hypothetical protein